MSRKNGSMLGDHRKLFSWKSMRKTETFLFQYGPLHHASSPFSLLCPSLGCFPPVLPTTCLQECNVLPVRVPHFFIMSLPLALAYSLIHNPSPIPVRLSCSYPCPPHPHHTSAVAYLPPIWTSPPTNKVIAEVLTKAGHRVKVTIERRMIPR